MTDDDLGKQPMRPWHIRRWPSWLKETYCPPRSKFDYHPESLPGIYKKLSRIPIFERYSFKNIYQRVWVFIGVLVSLATIRAIHQYAAAPAGFPIMYAALGASATIMFQQPNFPFNQPYHILIGHTICPAIAVSCQKILPSQPWLASALSGSLSITIMGLLGGVNPPGALAVLIPQLHTLGYLYVLGSLAGIGILYFVGFFINNFQRQHQLPYRWL